MPFGGRVLGTSAAQSGRCTLALLDEPLLRALGFERQPGWLRSPAAAVVRARSALVQQSPARPRWRPARARLRPYPVRDVDEAVERANASPYALGAAVFTAGGRTGLAVAERLRSGAVSVGSVLGFAAVPALPFGGSGESGYRRIHGDEGLRSFAAARSVTVRRFAPIANLTSYATPKAEAQRAVELARRFHARF